MKFLRYELCWLLFSNSQLHCISVSGIPEKRKSNELTLGTKLTLDNTKHRHAKHIFTPFFAECYTFFLL